MTEQEQAAKEKAEAEAKAKTETEAKAKAEAEAKARAAEEEEEEEESEEDLSEAERTRLRKKKRLAMRRKREKDMLDELFAPVKELLDEWSEYKNERNWTPKSKRQPATPPADNVPLPAPATGKAKGVDEQIDRFMRGFSGPGGIWNV